MDDTFFLLDIPNHGLRVYDTAREARAANFFAAPREVSRGELNDLYHEHGDAVVFSDKALERYLDR